MTISDMEQVRREMEHGVYDLTDNGKCTGCGQCCSNVLPMTDIEIQRISKYIKRYNIKECKHFVPTKEPALDMSCPFLDTSKDKDKCKIYEVRPQVCRDFICNPQKRESPKINGNIKVVFVRETFFWKGELNN